MKNITLSIFVPCLNEERNINDALSNIKEGVQDINYEILVTDDASKDKTIEIAKNSNTNITNNITQNNKNK